MKVNFINLLFHKSDASRIESFYTSTFFLNRYIFYFIICLLCFNFKSFDGHKIY